jgi:hypothetical protein
VTRELNVTSSFQLEIPRLNHSLNSRWFAGAFLGQKRRRHRRETDVNPALTAASSGSRGPLAGILAS